MKLCRLLRFSTSLKDKSREYFVTPVSSLVYEFIPKGPHISGVCVTRGFPFLPAIHILPPLLRLLTSPISSSSSILTSEGVQIESILLVYLLTYFKLFLNNYRFNFLKIKKYFVFLFNIL